MKPSRSLCLFVGVVAGLSSPAVRGAELSLHLPLARTAYQCNERIDVSVVRSSAESLPRGELMLKLKGEDGSQLAFAVAVGQAEAEAGLARSVEHLHLNGWLLRPGSYTIEAACDGATATTNITLHSHVRRSDFKLVNWGRAKGKEQIAQGEDSLGFNLFYGGYASDEEANFIRGGVDFMACCVMSGGHQMDLRQECDWSDPEVVRGGTRRVTKRAFVDRTRPNVWGVHFYDEPGLTWAKDAQTGEMSAHVVPWQLRSYEAAFGQAAPDWKKVDPSRPEEAAHWAQWARWKLGLMDAAWKDAQFGVSSVEPAYVSLTQSQYGYSAFSDGYYFNVVRSLPITSGHGGYHDWGPGYFNPSMFLEIARARDLAKPNWYLPTWYGSTTADEFRLEQYLSFQCGLQGLLSPPDLEPGGAPEKSRAAQGVVESNHLLQRLGPIFNTMAPTRPPVALLFSLSQFLHAQTLNRKVCYAHDTPHGRNMQFTYLAGKLLQHQFLPLLDEEVLDGTLAAQHRAIVLTSIDYLDPGVVTGLEDFIKQGGLVLLTADATVSINGAVKLTAAAGWPDAARIAELKKAGQNAEAEKLTRMRQALVTARQLADSIRPHLEKAGVRPPLTSTEPGLVVTRQAAGDVEYLFVVNATHDPEGNPMLGVKVVTATLTLPDDARPVYDAVHGGIDWTFQKEAGQWRGEFHFGPGQMRVFARTTRPIGGFTFGKPVVRRDYTQSQLPLRLDLGAAVFDGGGEIVGGSVPLRLIVTDPLGAIRYDLYRATDRGSLNLSLPLALNDPPGQWKATATELLGGESHTVSFTLATPPTCSIAAGATGRAVHWPEDRSNIFRFFRTQHKVTIVKGSAPFHGAAAERLARIIAPWNVQSAIVNAADVNKPRSLSAEEAVTWIGLDYAGRGRIKPGASNSPVQVGFAVEGPVILLGAPEDNPLVKFLADQRFLPYKPDKARMPGPSRGYVAWQREAIGVNQESITLIAYDAKGMDEAVGSVYEMLAGLEPLTPLAQPRASTVTPARGTERPREPAVVWSVVLPDRVTGLKSADGKLTALTHAATVSELEAGGKLISTKALSSADYTNLIAQSRVTSDAAVLAEARKSCPPNRLVKLALASGDQTAVAYWGGTLNLFDRTGTLKASRRFPQDITALVRDGSLWVVGDADGRLTALKLE
jgi:hypothetical protein